MARQPSSIGGQVGNSRFIIFDKFTKMNTKVARQNLPEDQAAWMENLQPISENVLQTVPGPNTSIATVTGKTVSRQFYANLSGTDYIIFVATDGSITAINAANGVQTVIATAGTFSAKPDVTVYSANRLLIMDLTGGYATWDGTLFVKSGGLSPNINVVNGASLYSSAPTVTFNGGNGTGATATAQVNAIVVGSVTVTNPGSGYTVAPGVTFTGGGGSGAAATAIVGPTSNFNLQGIQSITVTNGGSGYTTPPTVGFTGGGGGTGAAATAVLAGGSVVGVTLTNPGSGYLPTDQVTVVFSGGSVGGQVVSAVTVNTGGVGYTSTPSVGFSGGGGTGAAGTAVVSGGVVTSVVMTNEGSGYTSVPTVAFTGGGASTQATGTAVMGAIANARVWPQVFGNSIAIFAGRVWWSNGRILNFTGTGASTGGNNYDDLNPLDAAGSTTITDADLVHSINVIRALNNFLYIFGDQSIKQISSITVQNSITLFTILTLASDVGTSYQLTVQSYNRIVLFANKNGVHAIFGASVQKISDDLDGIFQLIDFSLEPSSALNDFHVNLPNTGGGSLHCYCLLVKYIDPVQGARNFLLCYQTNKWFIVSQNGNMLSVTNIPKAATTQWEIYGSAGSDVTQLLQNGSVGVSIRLLTALTPHGNIIVGKKLKVSGIAVTTLAAQNLMLTVDTENGSNPYTLSASSTVTWINNSSQVVQWQNNSLQNVNFLAGGYRLPYTATEGAGRVVGNTITASGVTNLAINAVMNEYEETKLWGGPYP